MNNIYVSAHNHGFDASRYILSLPPEAVGELHLAGHTLRDLEFGGSIRIDDHSTRVCAEVWRLYESAVRRFGPVPTLIEWDNDIPPLPVLLEEAAEARRRRVIAMEAADAHAA